MENIDQCELVTKDVLLEYGRMFMRSCDWYVELICEGNCNELRGLEEKQIFTYKGAKESQIIKNLDSKREQVIGEVRRQNCPYYAVEARVVDE